jgi:hypothetical protein
MISSLQEDFNRHLFIAQFAFSSGPTCILYLIKKTPDNTWSQLLPSAFFKQNLVLLYRQFQSSVVNHMNIKRAVDLETGLEKILQFYN